MLQTWGAALGGSGVGSVSKCVFFLTFICQFPTSHDHFTDTFSVFSPSCSYRYCLSHSPVPIIVVRPESKVRKVLAKRRADPKRGKHFDE